MKWEMVKLGEVIEKPISGEWGEGEGETYVLRTTNFRNDGSLSFENVVRRNISEKKIREKSLKQGDCIIEKSGGGPSQPVGRVVYFDNPKGIYLCNNFTSIIRPKAEVYPKYLFWYLFNNHLIGNTLSYQNKTTGIINLQLERYVSESTIPLPPLATQQRIADILDKADALRQKDQALLKKYDELAQAVFVEMFGDPVRNEKGWEVKKLGMMGSLDRGISKHRPRNAAELLGGKYPLIQTGDVANCDSVILDFKNTYSEFGLKQSKLWPRGTLCITIAANIAKTGILNFDACFPDSVVGFLPNEISNTNFIQAWFSFFQKIIEESAPESAQKNINLEILRNLDIICPPVKTQIRFSEVVDHIYTQKQKSQKSLSHSTALFQSLLQKAFTGELVP